MLGPRFGFLASAAEPAPAPDFHQQIEPILVEYCYECHGYGEKKGNVAFDEFNSDDDLLHNQELWWKALRNVRANIMPPPGKPRPSEEEKGLLAQWIKFKGFGIDVENPDPGRTTLRRLNRIEYRNTIRDLTGFDYKTNEEFPADDTGYGFDNIGDVLTVSPLLLEKYLKRPKPLSQARCPRKHGRSTNTPFPARIFIIPMESWMAAGFRFTCRLLYRTSSKRNTREHIVLMSTSTCWGISSLTQVTAM